MPAKLTLGKEERLKSRKATDDLFRRGQRFNASPFRVFFLQKEGNGLQFGIGAGAKNFSKAVDRNRIKRITRESWRLQKNSLKEQLEKSGKALDVFLVYTDKEILAYELVYKKVSVIINKLSGLLNENLPAHT